jgi:hypothetical protein
VYRKVAKKVGSKLEQKKKTDDTNKQLIIVSLRESAISDSFWEEINIIVNHWPSRSGGEKNQVL